GISGTFIRYELSAVRFAAGTLWDRIVASGLRSPRLRVRGVVLPIFVVLLPDVSCPDWSRTACEHDGTVSAGRRLCTSTRAFDTSPLRWVSRLSYRSGATPSASDRRLRLPSLIGTKHDVSWPGSRLPVDSTAQAGGRARFGAAADPIEQVTRAGPAWRHDRRGDRQPGHTRDPPDCQGYCRQPEGGGVPAIRPLRDRQPWRRDCRRPARAPGRLRRDLGVDGRPGENRYGHRGSGLESRRVADLLRQECLPGRRHRAGQPCQVAYGFRGRARVGRFED